jgi:hypothetical protein
VQAAGYEGKSALDLHTPAGMIGTDVIQHLYDAPLVIADLTGTNPNVYYELAVRHGYKKPVVQMVDRASLPLPFDIQTTRTIIYDTSDWDSIPSCLNQIAKQIEEVELNSDEVDNPIVQGFDLKTLRESSKSEDKSLVLLIEEMSAMRSQLNQIMVAQREDEIRRRHMNERDRIREKEMIRRRQELDELDTRVLNAKSLDSREIERERYRREIEMERIENDRLMRERELLESHRTHEGDRTKSNAATKNDNQERSTRAGRAK